LNGFLFTFSFFQLIKYQATCNETEIVSEKLKQTDRELADIRKEAINYQNMLQQSQTQYATLERKYSKVKKMLRDFQQRDRDMVRNLGSSRLSLN
jgi:neurabin